MLHRNKPLSNNETHTITTTEPSDALLQVFEKANADTHKRSGNYELSERVIAETCAYTVTYLHDTPVMASIAWARPFYNGAIRLASKYCVDPKFRHLQFGKGTENLFRLDTVDHITQQIEIACANGYTDFFLSQEDKSPGGKRVHRYVATLDKYTDYEWTCTSAPVLVCPDPQAPSCWQYVVSNNEIKFNASK